MKIQYTINKYGVKENCIGLKQNDGSLSNPYIIKERCIELLSLKRDCDFFH